jgi:acyl-coenzyme A thioesterase PaaI-like protein
MAGATSLEGLEGDAFWERYRSIMGPDGLLTYRYVGSHGAVALDRHHAESTARVRRDLRGPTGILASALSIMGGDAASAIDDAIAIPAPVHVTLVVLDDGAGVEDVRVRAEIAHEGRTQLVYRKRWEDAADPARVLAVGTSVSVVVGPAPEGHSYVPPGPGVPDDEHLPPLWAGFGARRRDDGAYELPELDAALGSTSASLHHGPTQVVLEAAAVDAATAAAGGDRLRLSHWDVTFTKKGKVGPFVAAAEVISARPDSVTCSAELRDEGVGDRVVAVATASFTRA